MSAALALSLLAVSTCTPDVSDMISVAENTERYVEKSVRIVAAAEANDTSYLSGVIAGDAQITIASSGHTAVTYRGVEGMIAIASQFEPLSYVHFYQSADGEGTFACYPFEIDVEFVSADQESGFAIKFFYENEMLVKAVSTKRRRVEGMIAKEVDNG